MNNILVTGAKGQLGSEIRDISNLYVGNRFFFKSSKDLDITDFTKTNDFIENNKISVIINCAAYTAVDKAELEFNKANEINHLAVKNLAEVSKKKSIKLVHISTDYVFDGNASIPYLETDLANPKTVYGKTKYAGEQAVLSINPYNSIIIRTSWVYSKFGNNFVKTMLRLGAEKEELNVIYDQIGTPTSAKDLAKIILDILPNIKNPEVEIFHYSNTGVCSWFDFAKAIFDISKISIKINPVETSFFKISTPRPSYTILNKSKIINSYKLKIPYWKDSLVRFLED